MLKDGLKQSSLTRQLFKHKKHFVKVKKIMVWLKTPDFVAINMVGKCPDMSLKTWVVSHYWMLKRGLRYRCVFSNREKILIYIKNNDNVIEVFLPSWKVEKYSFYLSGFLTITEFSCYSSNSTFKFFFPQKCFFSLRHDKREKFSWKEKILSHFQMPKYTLYFTLIIHFFYRNF